MNSPTASRLSRTLGALPVVESTSQRVEHEKLLAQRIDALRCELDAAFRNLSRANEPVLELCCGHGHFLTAYADAHPGELCLGVDFCRDRIRRASRKQARVSLANLHFIYGEAREFLAALPDGIRFKRVFILFPDPWPKRRHRKNRLVSPAFLTQLAAVTLPGGEFCFRTDAADYFREARGATARHECWTISTDRGWPFEHSTVFQEKAAGHESFVAINRCSATRSAQIAP